MLLKIGAALLVLWGLLNAVGGTVGSRGHPAQWIGALFLATGLAIVAGGVGFWLRKRWGAGVSLVGLLGLSIVALLSATILRGAAEIRLTHHLTRLALSGLFFVLALTGYRRVR